MLEKDNEKNTSSRPEGGEAPGGADPSRVNGEVRYKDGFTQRIYSDAHYVPEDESTVPPSYYKPSRKTVKVHKAETEEEPERRKISVPTAACICIISAVLSGLLGAVIVSSSFSARIEEVEKQLQLYTQADEELPIQSPAPVSGTGVSTAAGASDVYDRACMQVVGIRADNLQKDIFGDDDEGIVQGTGFIASKDGYVLTNYHVLKDAVSGGCILTVIANGGTEYPAELIGADEDSDIAVLKAGGIAFSEIRFGDSSTLKVGDEIFSVGNPLGNLDFSMTFGRISALNRSVQLEDMAAGIEMFQIDAAVNAGNSGGPVYNTRGEIVGIITAKAREAGTDGVGFVIPINDALNVANDLVTKGYVTGKAALGITVDDRYTSVYSRYYDMPMGAYVYSVMKGSCAAQAGIRAGDILTQLGGSAIESTADLGTALKNYSAGETVEVIVFRAGEYLKLRVIFDERIPGEAGSGYGSDF